MNNSVLDRYSDFRALVAKTFSANSAEMVDSALCFAAEALEDFGARRYDNNPMRATATPWSSMGLLS